MYSNLAKVGIKHVSWREMQVLVTTEDAKVFPQEEMLV